MNKILSVILLIGLTGCGIEDDIHQKVTLYSATGEKLGQWVTRGYAENFNTGITWFIDDRTGKPIQIKGIVTIQ